ncbi:MAG TPA: hypothetical protein V6D50_23375 [Chroococcales cyanobacterium]|jgi:hypothetical protein
MKLKYFILQGKANFPFPELNNMYFLLQSAKSSNKDLYNFAAIHSLKVSGETGFAVELGLSC